MGVDCTKVTGLLCPELKPAMRPTEAKSKQRRQRFLCEGTPSRETWVLVNLTPSPCRRCPECEPAMRQVEAIVKEKEIPIEIHTLY